MVRINTIYSDRCFPCSRFYISGKKSDGRYDVYVDGSTSWNFVFTGTLAECRQFVKFMFKSYIELK